MLAEQHPAAGCAVTAHLSIRHPSIYCTYIDAAQSSHLSFCEKLFVTGVLREHICLSLDYFSETIPSPRASALQQSANDGQHDSNDDPSHFSQQASIQGPWKPQTRICSQTSPGWRFRRTIVAARFLNTHLKITIETRRPPVIAITPNRACRYSLG
jgi:hypothetical protein